MAVVKNFKPKSIFLSPRIKSRLETIYDFNYTVVEAPTGYGKTVSVNEFLSKHDKPFIWFNVDNENKEQFFDDFCSRIDSIDKRTASKLRLEGFPFDVNGAKKISKILIDMELYEKTILVLDNYQFVSTEFLNMVFKDVTANKDSKLNIVILTREIISAHTFDLIYKKQLNYISKNDLEFNKEEIEKYCKACGVYLENEEAEYLYEYSEGWISAIYLLLFNFVTIGKFELTESINTLVVNGLWDNTSEKEKDFLITISIFENFTLKKATNICREILNESEIKRILENNEFIRFDLKKREYHIHSLLKYFLKYEFEKKEQFYKKSVYKKIGDWYSLNDDCFFAIKYYHEIEEIDSILSMDYNLGELISHTSKKNKNIFMDVVSLVSLETKEAKADKFIMYLVAIFLYNERDLLFSECEKMEKILKSSEILSENDKQHLLGDLKIIEAVCYFNDLNEMGKRAIEAEEYLKGPSKIFYNYCSLLFGCPSPLGLYHKTPGGLDQEIQSMNEYIQYMYRLSGGRGKGTEALLKGQALFYRGDLDGAEILAHKAIYMSETRSQLTVYIGGMILLGKIQVFNGDEEAFKDTIENIKSKVNDNDRLLKKNLIDLAIGSIGVFIEDLEMVPEWLKKPDTIEDNCNLVTLGYANCIYGKYLIIKQKYSQLLGISGQFIGVTNVFSSIIYKIYTYIYVSIANHKTGNDDKALKFLIEAIDLAIADNLYFPFVENFSRIEVALNLIPINSSNAPFFKKVHLMAKTFEKGREMIVKSISIDKNHGLTKREAEVAKLAASRMSNKEIADKLFIAESTVKSNMKIIFNKLGIESRTELNKFF